MKIVYILNEGAQGGASIAFMNMLPELLKNNIIPIVIIPEKNSIYVKLKTMNIEVLVRNYKPNTYPHLYSFKYYLLFIPRLIARRLVNYLTIYNLSHKLRNLNIDIIHTNTSVIDIGSRIAKKIKVPHIYHIREYADLYYRLYPCNKIFLKQFYKPNTYTICITNAIQQYYKLNNKSCSKVIYDGVMSNSYYTEAKKRDNFLLFVGRIEYGKGIDKLINTYIELKKENINVPNLIIVGKVNDIKLYNKLCKEIKKANINNISFIGEQKNVNEYLQRAKAVVIASKNEGFGFVMAEAMFNHCLVIGKNSGGTKEQFDNGFIKSGQEIGFRYNSQNELKQIILNIKNITDESYNIITDRAYYIVKKLYSIESCVEEIISFYKQILK